MRLDSFSKVLAPGLRLGWIVGQKDLLERYVRLHEVSVQNPSGFQKLWPMRCCANGAIRVI